MPRPMSSIYRNMVDENGDLCDIFRVASMHDVGMNRLAKWCNSTSVVVEIAHGTTRAIASANMHLLVSRQEDTWEHYNPYWEFSISEPYTGSMDQMIETTNIGRTVISDTLGIMSDIRKLRRSLNMSKTPEKRQSIQDELDELLAQIR